jgi:hypothetical protein
MQAMSTQKEDNILRGRDNDDDESNAIISEHNIISAFIDSLPVVQKQTSQSQESQMV